MTPDAEKELIALLGRVAVAFERIADHLAPAVRTKHTAILGTATYSVEERERQTLRDTLKGRGSKSGEAGAKDSKVPGA